jgi:hypothetical protein
MTVPPRNRPTDGFAFRRTLRTARLAQAIDGGFRPACSSSRSERLYQASANIASARVAARKAASASTLRPLDRSGLPRLNGGVASVRQKNISAMRDSAWKLRPPFRTRKGERPARPGAGLVAFGASCASQPAPCGIDGPDRSPACNR